MQIIQVASDKAFPSKCGDYSWDRGIILGL